MNWKIFLFKAQVTADIPFDAIVEFIKRRSNRGSRFKFRTADKNEARVFYAYRQGIYERLGYWDGSTAEVIITNKLDDNVAIDFTFPNSVLIAYGLIAILIFAAGLFIIPGLGVWGSVIILLAIYFGVVIRLNSQFYFFKSDLDQLEENFKRGFV